MMNIKVWNTLKRVVGYLMPAHVGYGSVDPSAIGHSFDGALYQDGSDAAAENLTCVRLLRIYDGMAESRRPARSHI